VKGENKEERLMPTIQVPTIYRGHTRREASLNVSGATVGACLDAAEAEYPGFRALVVDDAGMTHKFNKVFLDGALLSRDPAVLETAVAEGAEIEVMAAIAGG
jgi:molybdopterin synthase sulfur carrier subunit